MTHMEIMDALADVGVGRRQRDRVYEVLRRKGALGNQVYTRNGPLFDGGGFTVPGGGLPGGLVPHVDSPAGGSEFGNLGGCVGPETASQVTQPYTLLGNLELAAGAQTQAVDLFDFHDQANNSDIATDNLIPKGVVVSRAMLIASPRVAALDPGESLAFVLALRFVERAFGRDLAHWAPWEVGGFVYAPIAAVGTLTAGVGAAAHTIHVPPDWAKGWYRAYDGAIEHELAAQTTRTQTTTNDIAFTLAERGVRGISIVGGHRFGPQAVSAVLQPRI